jgi:hypothetical protein
LPPLFPAKYCTVPDPPPPDLESIPLCDIVYPCSLPYNTLIATDPEDGPDPDCFT